MAWGACDLSSTQVGPRRAAVGRPAADAHRGRERVARGGGALGLLRRRRRLPGLPAAATERVEGHVSRGLLVLPTDESYADPPTIWRSPPLWTRVIDWNSTSFDTFARVRKQNGFSGPSNQSKNRYSLPIHQRYHLNCCSSTVFRQQAAIAADIWPGNAAAARQLKTAA